ncbi:MAG: hypothetical protein ACRD1U_14025 [Vicinamibacterales bacterium]
MTRSISSVLLGAGVGLVFLGLSASFGFTAGGMIASLIAVGVLMYAGAIWAAPGPSRLAASPVALVVFDRDRRIVSGGVPGESLTAQFPEMLRPEIGRRAEAALGGSTERFPCLHGGRFVVFEVLPVRDAQGAIVYGILLSTEGEPAAIAASGPYPQN